MRPPVRPASRPPWHPATLIGTRLGFCVLERCLGVGGMGAVYAARQERPRRAVAVKVLRPPERADPQARVRFLARFRREADAMAALDHANIVPIFAFGEHDGLAYLVMPLLTNGSLADILAQTGALPGTRALGYLAQTAAALDYAHARGLVHRDVKPANLLLHQDGRLLLADFGIASPLDHASPAAERNDPSASDADPPGPEPDAPLGTPQYMAPEQLRGEPVSAATDIYALGVLAVTLLSGRPAGALPSPTAQRLLPHQFSQAPQPSHPQHTLPFGTALEPRVEAVLGWALSLQPADRPVTAARFVQALANALEAEALPTGPHMDPLAASHPASHLTPHTPPYAARSAYDAPTLAGLPDSAASDPGPTHPWPTNPWRTDPPRQSDLARWPLDQTSPQNARLDMLGLRAHQPRRYRLPPLMAHMGARLVVGLGLLCVLVLGPLLWALASGIAPTSGPSRSAVSAPLAPTPLPTPTALPSPTPVVNWLSVAPASVSLGCSGTAKAATVVLRNLGSAETGWSATVPFLGGVSASPSRSRHLASGQSVTVTVTNTSLLVAHHGTITFTPTDKQAGQPATLTYSTQPCY
jgi:serine/threonine protein kinase